MIHHLSPFFCLSLLPTVVSVIWCSFIPIFLPFYHLLSLCFFPPLCVCQLYLFDMFHHPTIFLSSIPTLYVTFAICLIWHLILLLKCLLKKNIKIYLLLSLVYVYMYIYTRENKIYTYIKYNKSLTLLNCMHCMLCIKKYTRPCE